LGIAFPDIWKYNLTINWKRYRKHYR